LHFVFLKMLLPLAALLLLDEPALLQGRFPSCFSMLNRQINQALREGFAICGSKTVVKITNPVENHAFALVGQQRRFFDSRYNINRLFTLFCERWCTDSKICTPNTVL